MNRYRVEVIVYGSHEVIMVDATSHLDAMDAVATVMALDFDTNDYDVYEVELL